MSLNRTFTEESETDGLEGGIAANGFGKPGSNRLVRALVIVNLQNDYFEGGSFPVPEADGILGPINDLRAKHFDFVFVCTTHHPLNYSGFASNNPGVEMFTVVSFPSSGPQTMYPDHLVQGSSGAALVSNLIVKPTDISVTIGMDPRSDGCSFLSEGHSGHTSYLKQILSDQKVDQLFFVGLVMEKSVLFSALDAKLLLPDAEVFVVEDCCRGTSSSAMAEAIRRLDSEGVGVVMSTGPLVSELMDARPDTPFALPIKIITAGQEVLHAPPVTAAAASEEESEVRASSVRPGGLAHSPTSKGSLRTKSRKQLNVPQAASKSRLEPVSGEASWSVRRCRGSFVQFQPNALVLAASYGSWHDVSLLLRHFGSYTVDSCMAPLGLTALHIAVLRGSVRMTRTLLEAGARPEVPSDANHSTALLLAAKTGNTQIAALLIEYCNPSNLADLIEAHETDAGMTPIMYAAQNCDPVMMRLLLRGAHVAGVETEKLVTRASYFGVNALMLACATVPALGLIGEDSGLVEFSIEDSTLADEDLSLNSDATDTLLAGSRPLRTQSRMDRIPVMTSVMSESAKQAVTVAEDAAKKSQAAAWRVEALSAIRRAERVLHLMLTSCPKGRNFVDLLRKVDVLGWNSFHYAARSGLLGYLDWKWLLGTQLRNVPVKMTNLLGATMLHLATWNGHVASVATLLSPWPKTSTNPWSTRLDVNKLIKTQTGGQFSELDLSILKRYVECSRVLVRSKCHAQSLCGLPCDELLHRFILLGDGVGAEYLLADPHNGVQVTQPLIDLMQRLSFLNACTFSFATHANPLTQHMYECTTCNQVVCVVCMRTCHGDHPYRDLQRPTPSDASPDANPRHSLHSLGPVVDASCGCQKSTCCALGVVDRREAAGYRYIPDPIDTSGVQLDLKAGSELLTLVEQMAWNSHEVWAKEKRAQGWRYGPKRDNRRKIHPMMLPYARLSEEDKRWDFTTAEEAVKVIRALGFRVKRGEALTSVTSNLSEDMLRRTMVPLGPPPESNLASPLLEPLEGRGRLLSDAVSPDGSGDFSGTIVPSRPSAVSAHRSSLRITTGALDVARPRTASRMSQKDNSPESTSREEVPMLILGSKSLTEEEAGALYLPRPFDTAGVKIAQDMKELVDLLARHFHEVWARDKLKQGWKFAPDRVQTKKEKRDPASNPQVSPHGPETSPLLVPFEFLTEKEKASSVHSATEMIRTILYLGYRFERDTISAAGESSLAFFRGKHVDPMNSRENMQRMQQFKQGVLNACLFSAARQGSTVMTRQLLAPNGTFQPYVNCTDQHRRTPLLVAVQHGQRAVCAVLLEFRADVEYPDDFGVSPMSLAAFLGDVKTCRLLLRHGAQFTIRDRAGLIPLQYAIYSGEIRVVSLLSKKMALRSSAPIKTNMALVAAAKDEEQKLKRKKEQLPVKEAWKAVFAAKKIAGGMSNASIKPLAKRVIESREQKSGMTDSETIIPVSSSTDRRPPGRFLTALRRRGPHGEVRVAVEPIPEGGGSEVDEGSGLVSPRAAADDVVIIANAKLAKRSGLSPKSSSDPESSPSDPSSSPPSGSPPLSINTHDSILRPMRLTGFTPASRRMPALLEVTEGPNGIQRTETMEEAGGDAEKEEVPLLFPSPRAKPKDDNGGFVMPKLPELPAEPTKSFDLSQKLVTPRPLPASSAVIGTDEYGLPLYAKHSRKSLPAIPAVSTDPEPAPRLSAAGGAGGALVGKVSAVAKHAEKKPAPVFAITEDHTAESSPDQKKPFRPMLSVSKWMSRPRTTSDADKAVEPPPTAPPTPGEMVKMNANAILRLMKPSANNAHKAGPAYAYLPSHVEATTTEPAHRISIVLPSASLSPLSVAVHAKQFDVALLLLRHGADPTQEDGCGESPYDLSLMQHSLAIARTKAITVAPPTVAVIREIAAEARMDKRQLEEALGNDEKVDKGNEAWGKLREAILSKHRALQLPKTSSLFTNEIAEKRRIAAEEKRREVVLKLAKSEQMKCEQMSLVLNNSPEVQSKRKRFALFVLLRQAFYFILVMTVFAVTTPTAVDFGSSTMARYRSIVNSRLQETYDIRTREDWWVWFDKHILWVDVGAGEDQSRRLNPDREAWAVNDPVYPYRPQPQTIASRPYVWAESILQPSGSQWSSPSLLLNESVVLGSVRVRVEHFKLTGCATQYGVDFGSYQPVCVSPASEADENDWAFNFIVQDYDPFMLLNAAPGGSVAYDLDSADLRARRTIASSHKDVNAADPWLAPTTRLVSLEVSAYQPSLGLFVSSRLATWISATGGFRNFVDSRVFRLNTNRFQPSPVFEVVILLFILVQSLSIYAEHSSVTSVRQLLDQPWVMLELTTILVFIAAFVLDTAQLAKMQELTLSVDQSATYVPLWDFADNISVETDIIAAGMFLVVLRFIKYLRVIPGWGPMLLAVVDTLKNATVLLYLAVMMGLQLACAFAFNIAFGADNNYFSSITRSFTTVFKMGFSMNDDDYLGWSYPRAAVTIFFFLHVLLSIVLLNLFIGIITELYPKARRQSQVQWDVLITRLLQNENDQKRWEKETPDSKKRFVVLRRLWLSMKTALCGLRGKPVKSPQPRTLDQLRSDENLSASLASRFTAFSQLEKVMKHLQEMAEEAAHVRKLITGEDAPAVDHKRRPGHGGVPGGNARRLPAAAREEEDGIGSALDLLVDDEFESSDGDESNAGPSEAGVSNYQAPTPTSAVAAQLRAFQSRRFMGGNSAFLGPEDSMFSPPHMQSNGSGSGSARELPSARLAQASYQSSALVSGRGAFRGSPNPRSGTGDSKGPSGSPPDESAGDPRVSGLVKQMEAFESTLGDMRGMLDRLVHVKSETRSAAGSQ